MSHPGHRFVPKPALPPTAVRPARAAVFSRLQFALPAAILALFWGIAVAQAAPLRLTPVKAESVGLGGAGAMFWPSVSPHDPRLMFVSCDMSGFYRTADGGKQWQMLDGRQIQGGYQPPRTVFFHPTDPNAMFTYGPGKGGNALRVSHDRGLTWSIFVQAPPWKNAWVQELEIDPDDTARFLAGTSTGLFLSTDHGQSWSAMAGIPGSVIGLFVDPTSPAAARHLYAATKDAVFRSEDGGATWQDASAGLPWRDIRHFAGGAAPRTKRASLYVTIPSKAVDGRFEGGVYRSTDGGRTWTSAMGLGINTRLGKQDEYGIGDIAEYDWLGMAANNPDVVYTVTPGTGYWPPYHFTVFKTTDGGKTWNYVFNGDPRFKEKNV